MRILMVGPLPPPIGGMATVVENLREALAAHGQVRVLNNVKTTPPDRALWQGVAAQSRLLWRLGALCLGWRPQVVHIHTCSWFNFWRQGVDVLLVRLLGRRAVLHIHGAEFHKFLSTLHGPLAWLARRIFSACNRVIVLGDEWLRVLEPWCGRERIVVVPNGVPVPARPVPVPREPLIVCLANYERRKGQDDLLRAVAGLSEPRPRVALLGAEAEAGRQSWLQSLGEELGLEDQVEIPGPKMGGEKDAWLRRAAVFCLPSHDEGLPMAMLEAMAAGVPVVATRVGAIPEAVKDGAEGRLYDAGDVDALRVCLQDLLADPEQARKLGLAGRRRVKREFSLERQARRLMDAYRSMIIAG